MLAGKAIVASSMAADSRRVGVLFLLTMAAAAGQGCGGELGLLTARPDRAGLRLEDAGYSAETPAGVRRFGRWTYE